MDKFICVKHNLTWILFSSFSNRQNEVVGKELDMEL